MLWTVHAVVISGTRRYCKVGASVERRAYLDLTCLRHSDPEGSSSRQNWFDGYRDRVSGYFVGRLVFGRVSLQPRASTARSSSSITTTTTINQCHPPILTRTFAVHIDAGHHCYKCCSSRRHSRCSFADRGHRHCRETRRPSQTGFFFKGPLARVLMKLICMI